MRLTFLLACLAGAVAADDTPQPAPARMAGQHDVCVAGRAHRVTYDVNHVTDSSGQPSIYDVDTFSALKSVECNVDESSLKIIWHDEIHSSAFYLKVKTFGAYLVGSSCPMPVKEVKKVCCISGFSRAAFRGLPAVVTSYRAFLSLYLALCARAFSCAGQCLLTWMAKP